MRLRLLSLLLLTMSLPVLAQQAVFNKQRHFPKTVPAGNYSGITWLGGDRYAVVNDKSPSAGFYLMTIRLDSLSGQIVEAHTDSFLTSGQPNRDEEGICYVPQTNTVFVSSEADGQIVEYAMDGQLTGRRMNIPEVFRTAYSNRGFESLTYNAATHRFWTTSENTLSTDGPKPSIHQKIPNQLRLQSFGDDLQPREQYWYLTDSSAVKSTTGKSTLGVSALAALDDGQLIVLEREIRVTEKYIGSFVQVRLYRVDPTRQTPGQVLEKQLLAEFRTSVNLTDRSFANYEGLCAGPRLADGRQVLLLIADSQDQYKGWLKDWLKTIVFSPEQLAPITASRPTALPNKKPASPQSFLKRDQLPNGIRFLPAPPSLGSPEFANDEYYYQWGKEQRRDADVARQAEADEIGWTSTAFSPAVGFTISPDSTPEIFKLVEGARKDAHRANSIVKKHYQRRRPFAHFGEPSLVERYDSAEVNTFSFPSGHSSRGWIYAMVLATVVPDSTEALMLRARQYALNRVICGRHYKSDIDASLMVATATFCKLMADDEFQRQLARAREEYARIRKQ